MTRRSEGLCHSEEARETKDALWPRRSHFADEPTSRILHFDATLRHRTIAIELGTLGAAIEAVGVR